MRKEIAAFAQNTQLGQRSDYRNILEIVFLYCRWGSVIGRAPVGACLYSPLQFILSSMPDNSFDVVSIVDLKQCSERSSAGAQRNSNATRPRIQNRISTEREGQEDRHSSIDDFKLKAVVKSCSETGQAQSSAEDFSYGPITTALSTVRRNHDSVGLPVEIQRIVKRSKTARSGCRHRSRATSFSGAEKRDLLQEVLQLLRTSDFGWNCNSLTTYVLIQTL
jgi:hypothetical protein